MISYLLSRLVCYIRENHVWCWNTIFLRLAFFYIVFLGVGGASDFEYPTSLLSRTHFSKPIAFVFPTNKFSISFTITSSRIRSFFFFFISLRCTTKSTWGVTLHLWKEKRKKGPSGQAYFSTESSIIAWEDSEGLAVFQPAYTAGF